MCSEYIPFIVIKYKYKNREKERKKKMKTAVKKSNIFFGFMLFANINNKIVCSAYRFDYT